MANFAGNLSPSAASTSDQSEYDLPRRAVEYGEPSLVTEHSGPYWARPVQEREADAGQDACKEAQSIHETREVIKSSELVLRMGQNSQSVHPDVSSRQQSPSQGDHAAELEQLIASASADIQTFQQKAAEVNRMITEDLAHLNHVLGASAQDHQKEKDDTAMLHPRAIPQSDGEEYAPGISYDMFLKMRTDMCGKVTPSKLAPGQAPIQQVVYADSPRRFICPICQQGRTRVKHVEAHFARCAELNGNPRGLHWFDHPTTLGYYAERKTWRTRIGTDPQRGPRVEVPEDAWEEYRSWRSGFDPSPFARESVPEVSWTNFLEWKDARDAGGQ